MIAAAMIVPFYTLLAERAGGDILEAGLAASVLAVAAGISVLVAGRLSDNITRKERIIATGYLLTAVGFFLYVWVDSLWMLLCVQALIGLAQASYVSTYDALYSAHIGDRRRASSRWSFWEASSYFSVAIGAFTGGVLAHLFGLDVLFITMGLLCLCSSLYLFQLPQKTL